MKKSALLLAVLLSCGACKGSKGDPGQAGIQGVTGPQGPTGNNKIDILSGSVTSDDFTIHDVRIQLAGTVNVYSTDGTVFTAMPYFLAGSGVNTYFLVDPNAGTIEFFNMQTASASGYLVAMVEE